MDTLKGLLMLACFSAGAFIMGYQNADHKCSLLLKEAETRAQIEQAETERRNSELTEELATLRAEAAQSLDDINRRYLALLNRPDRMRDTAAASSGEGGDAPRTASGACQPCTDGHDAKDGESFKALRRELLTISRDCDAQAVKYNTLLQLYQEAAKNER